MKRVLQKSQLLMQDHILQQQINRKQKAQMQHNQNNVSSFNKLECLSISFLSILPNFLVSATYIGVYPYIFYIV